MTIDRRKRVSLWIGVLVISLVGYFAAYAMLLDNIVSSSYYDQNDILHTDVGPTYRINNAFVEMFFGPANLLDRMIRPGMYSFPEPKDGEATNHREKLTGVSCLKQSMNSHGSQNQICG